jgi:hypothetical protein
MARNLPTYATVTDLRDVYPNINKYDSKNPIYNWKELFTEGGYKLYQANNSGLVNLLFRDGEDLTAKVMTENYVDADINTAESIDLVETSIDVTDGSVLTASDIIKIDDEKMLVIKVTTNTLTVVRGFFGTTVSTHVSPSDVYKGVDFTEDNQWIYSAEDDSALLWTLSSTDPNDSLMESGEDWATHKTDLLYKASRYFDSYVDATLPQRMHKNSEGEYPYLVIRTTAQICAYFLISAHDPENEDGLRIKEEYEEILDKLVNGQIKLDYEKSSDSAKGILTELYSNASSTLKPLDIIGTYTGSNYDKILIKIHTSGYIGQAKFNCYVRSDDALGVSGEAVGASPALEEEVIDGSYQHIGNGLYIRFGATTPLASGSSVNNYLVNAVCTAGDAYEIEVFPKGAEIDDARGIKSANLTRS